MKSIDYEINMMGLRTKDGSIPISALKEIVDVQHFEYTDEFLIENKSNSRALRKIWGKWPGDESIDELLSALDGRPH